MTEFPPLPQFDVHAVALPSKEVGGDFYDLVTRATARSWSRSRTWRARGCRPRCCRRCSRPRSAPRRHRFDSSPRILRNINALVYRGTRSSSSRPSSWRASTTPRSRAVVLERRPQFPAPVPAARAHAAHARAGGPCSESSRRSSFDEESGCCCLPATRLCSIPTDLTEAEAPTASCSGRASVRAARRTAAHYSAREMSDGSSRSSGSSWWWRGARRHHDHGAARAGARSGGGRPTGRSRSQSGRLTVQRAARSIR
jgi:hypothetical protein